MIGCGRSITSTPPRSLVILSILLAQSFRVSSAVIAVRVRLCKSMELRHGSTRASLACKSTSHRVAEQPSLVHFPTRQRKKAWPAHPHPDHWFVSSRLISTSDRFLLSLHTARTHCASIDPAAVELRLHFCYQASSTLATDTTIHEHFAVEQLSSLNCKIPLICSPAAV
jgi:hypothetical protein